MNKKRMLRLVLVPVLLGLAVTLIARQMLAAPEQSAAAVPVEMVSVVAVAPNQSIEPRTKLTAQHLTMRSVPKESLIGLEFTALSEVVGKVTTVSLAPGEPVLTTRLITDGQGALPYRIPEGRRAVTMRMDELNGVAGHPQPGDLVDLVLVLPEGTGRIGASSRLLFERVLVLAKGPNLPDGEIDTGFSSITIALRPEEAVELALAEQIGHIKLLLRPALAEPDTGEYTMREGSYN